MFSYLRASRSVQGRAKVVGFAGSRRGRREKTGVGRQPVLFIYFFF